MPGCSQSRTDAKSDDPHALEGCHDRCPARRRRFSRRQTRTLVRSRPSWRTHAAWCARPCRWRADASRSLSHRRRPATRDTTPGRRRPPRRCAVHATLASLRPATPRSHGVRSRRRAAAGRPPVLDRRPRNLARRLRPLRDERRRRSRCCWRLVARRRGDRPRQLRRTADQDRAWIVQARPCAARRPPQGTIASRRRRSPPTRVRRAQPLMATRRRRGRPTCLRLPHVSSPRAGAAPRAGTFSPASTTPTCRRSAYAPPGITQPGAVPTRRGVDPAVVPLGTRLTIPGYGDAVASDTGGAIRGTRIDVWLPTVERARSWGTRTVTVTIHRR